MPCVGVGCVPDLDRCLDRGSRSEPGSFCRDAVNSILEALRNAGGTPEAEHAGKRAPCLFASLSGPWLRHADGFCGDRFCQACHAENVQDDQSRKRSAHRVFGIMSIRSWSSFMLPSESFTSGVGPTWTTTRIRAYATFGSCRARAPCRGGAPPSSWSAWHDQRAAKKTAGSRQGSHRLPCCPPSRRF